MAEKLQQYDARLHQLERDSVSLKSTVHLPSKYIGNRSTALGNMGIVGATSEIVNDMLVGTENSNQKTTFSDVNAEGSVNAVSSVTPNVFAIDENDFMTEEIIEHTFVPVICDEFPLAQNDECLPFLNTETDSLLRNIQPHESQIQYRMSAAKYLKRQLKSTISNFSYEVGFQSINCFLPADPLRVCVIVSQSQSAYWFTTVAERLKGLAEGSISPSTRYSDALDDTEEDIVMAHIVRNVNVVSEQNQTKITCMLDASLEVEICTNVRLDMCLFTFLNEFDNLVGKDHLFKRTLLLVRSWWFYESASPVNTPVRHYLSEQTICIMLVAVFNIYSQQINSVFEAFVYFLRDFSQYDGKNHVITVQGIVPFQSETSNVPCMVRPQPNHLISVEILEKYWQLFNLTELSNPAAPAYNQPNVRQNILLQNIHKTLGKFERYGFNVTHPFLFVNVLAEKLSSRRLTLISKVFQVSYTSLLSLIEQSKINTQATNELVKSFFPAIYSRFVHHWRPDAINNSMLLPNGLEFSRLV